MEKIKTFVKIEIQIGRQDKKTCSFSCPYRESIKLSKHKRIKICSIFGKPLEYQEKNQEKKKRINNTIRCDSCLESEIKSSSSDEKITYFRSIKLSAIENLALNILDIITNIRREKQIINLHEEDELYENEYE